MDLTKDVRKILVKHWLDMGRIRIQVAGGTVIIRGRLKRSRSDEPVDGLFLEQLDQRLQSVKGLKNLRWGLEAWVFDRGQWRNRPK